MKIAPPGTRPVSGSPLNRAFVSLSTTRSTCSSSLWSRMCAVGDRQVIGRRQALLFGAILGIGLHVLAEHFAGDRGDDLVRRHRAEAADRVAAHRKRAGAAKIGIFGHFQRQGMLDADAEVVLAVLDHVVDDGDEVARAHVAAAQARRAAVDSRHAVDLLDGRSGRSIGIAECRFDLASQMIAGRRERIVHPLDHGERLAVLQGFDDLHATGTAGSNTTLRQPTLMPFFSRM